MEGTNTIPFPVAAGSLAFCLGLVFTLTACSDDDPVKPDPRPTPVEYNLPANVDTSLSVNVTAGQTLAITATGTVNTNPGGPVADCDLWTDADGIADCHYVTSAPECRSLPFMALIGLWDGDWFLVGTSWTRNLTEDGVLILKINDWVYGDNDGALVVSVLVD